MGQEKFVAYGQPSQETPIRPSEAIGLRPHETPCCTRPSQRASRKRPQRAQRNRNRLGNGPGPTQTQTTSLSLQILRGLCGLCAGLCFRQDGFWRRRLSPPKESRNNNLSNYVF